MVHFFIVVSFAVALVATGAIQHEYSPGGGVQWLLPLKNSGRNAIHYILSRIRYQYSENLVADEKVHVNSIPFIVTYTFLIHL
jgi:hypothetical protein